ncbi:MAG TPA: YdcF family protein [Longimicrobium sp.]|nr:YdcF family protein [Longimicrobium sp.]
MTSITQTPTPDPAPPKRRRVRRRWRALAAVVALVVAAYLLRAPILTGVARFLSTEDPLRKADIIFVLGGDVDVRPFLAAELYREGWAPRVVLPRSETGRAAAMGVMPHQTDVAANVLRRLGVPDSAVVVLHRPGGSTSTADDAALLADHLRRAPARRVIAVTTRYHLRRTRWHLRRALEGTDVELVMRGAPHPGFSETDWWKTESGLIAYVNEYLKFAHNLFR